MRYKTLCKNKNAYPHNSEKTYPLNAREGVLEQSCKRQTRRVGL